MTTNDLAARLGVTAGVGVGMVKKLAELGLVDARARTGACADRRRASASRSRSCATTGCSSSTSPSTSACRGTACTRRPRRSSTYISEDLEARIAEKLGNPTHDPHGDPIPSAELEIDEGDTRALESLAVGDRARFVRISDSDPEMLRYLEQRGIRIGDEFELVDRQPFDGPLTLRFGGGDEVIGGDARALDARRARRLTGARRSVM